MAESWFDAYDSVGGGARFDTAAVPAGPSTTITPTSGGFWSTNGSTLLKAAGFVGGALLLVNVIADRGGEVVQVRTVPAVTVTPVPVPVMTGQVGPGVTVAEPDAKPVVVVPSGGFGHLMENVCGNASTGFRMCRGSERNAAQLAANWPPS